MLDKEDLYPLTTESCDDLNKLADQGRIYSCSWLIQKDHFGFGHEYSAPFDKFLLAKTQLARKVLGQSR